MKNTEEEEWVACGKCSDAFRTRADLIHHIGDAHMKEPESRVIGDLLKHDVTRWHKLLKSTYDKESWTEHMFLDKNVIRCKATVGRPYYQLIENKSRKIQKLCPAASIVNQPKNGKFKLQIYSRHVGHPSTPLDAKIAPNNEIIQNEETPRLNIPIKYNFNQKFANQKVDYNPNPVVTNTKIKDLVNKPDLTVRTLKMGDKKSTVVKGLKDYVELSKNRSERICNSIKDFRVYATEKSEPIKNTDEVTKQFGKKSKLSKYKSESNRVSIQIDDVISNMVVDTKFDRAKMKHAYGDTQMGKTRRKKSTNDTELDRAKRHEPIFVDTRMDESEMKEPVLNFFDERTDKTKSKPTFVDTQSDEVKRKKYPTVDVQRMPNKYNKPEYNMSVTNEIPIEYNYSTAVQNNDGLNKTQQLICSIKTGLRFILDRVEQLNVNTLENISGKVQHIKTLVQEQTRNRHLDNSLKRKLESIQQDDVEKAIDEALSKYIEAKKPNLNNEDDVGIPKIVDSFSLKNKDTDDVDKFANDVEHMVNNGRSYKAAENRLKLGKVAGDINKTPSFNDSYKDFIVREFLPTDNDARQDRLSRMTKLHRAGDKAKSKTKYKRKIYAPENEKSDIYSDNMSMRDNELSMSENETELSNVDLWSIPERSSNMGRILVTPEKLSNMDKILLMPEVKLTKIDQLSTPEKKVSFSTPHITGSREDNLSMSNNLSEHEVKSSNKISISPRKTGRIRTPKIRFKTPPKFLKKKIPISPYKEEDNIASEITLIYPKEQFVVKERKDDCNILVIKL